MKRTPTSVLYLDEVGAVASPRAILAFASAKMRVDLRLSQSERDAPPNWIGWTPGDPNAGVGDLNWLAAVDPADARISNNAAFGAQKRVAGRGGAKSGEKERAGPRADAASFDRGTMAGGLPDGSRKKTSVV